MWPKSASYNVSNSGFFLQQYNNGQTPKRLESRADLKPDLAMSTALRWIDENTAIANGLFGINSAK